MKVVAGTEKTSTYADAVPAFTKRKIHKVWRIERDGFIWFETESDLKARQAIQILQADENATDELNALPD